MGIELTRQ
jgi:hypothetical protein